MRTVQDALTLASSACLAAACTSLGPLPATTGIVARPAPRSGVELQLGVVPGYFVSQAVVEDPEGAAIPQVAALLDLGRELGLPGLLVGGRWVNAGEDDGYPEPMLGYRSHLGSGRVAAAFVAHAGHGEATSNGASYAATRVGLEASVDWRVTPTSRWLELHLFGGTGLAVLRAEGTYCTSGEGGFATDCPEEPPAFVASAEAKGVYPATTLGVAVDGGRHLPAFFHGARLALQVAGGLMPRVVGGEQTEARGYAAIGLSLTVGLGAAE